MSTDYKDKISAYLNSEMTPEELSEFEKLLETNQVLKQEVEELVNTADTVKEWLATDVPGIDKVSDLEIPEVKTILEIKTHKPPKKQYYSYFWKSAAAAAIFILGFTLGNINQEQNIVPERGAKPDVITTEKSEKEKPKEKIVQKKGIQMASLPIHKQIYNEGDKIMIETELSGSGSKILWVVDGEFRMNGN